MNLVILKLLAQRVAMALVSLLAVSAIVSPRPSCVS